MVEVLLCRPLYRERFLYICVGEKRAAVESQLEGFEVAGNFRVHLSVTPAGKTSQATCLHAECEGLFNKILPFGLVLVSWTRGVTFWLRQRRVRAVNSEQ